MTLPYLLSEQPGRFSSHDYSLAHRSREPSSTIAFDCRAELRVAAEVVATVLVLRECSPSPNAHAASSHHHQLS
jgi:hypothetical protein